MLVTKTRPQLWTSVFSSMTTFAVLVHFQEKQFADALILLHFALRSVCLILAKFLLFQALDKVLDSYSLIL